MTGKSDKAATLEAAYGLSTPDDNRRLYRDWAATYDETFISVKGYEYPARIAALYDERSGDGQDGGRRDAGPVLDVGCGTGAVAEALKARPVDGVDISPEMLSAAQAKGVYRTLIETDLTDQPDLPEGAYNGVVSAGTFTHGHVGPEALIPLTRAARPGALFVIGVNAEVFARLPFQQVLDGLVRDGVINGLESVEGRIYGDDADHDHADDMFRALLFRRS